MAKGKLSSPVPMKAVQLVAQKVGQKGGRKVNFASDNFKGGKK